MSTPDTSATVVPSAVPTPPEKGNGKTKRVRVTITSLRYEIEHQQHQIASLRLTVEGLRGLLMEANIERFNLQEKLQKAEVTNTQQTATLAKTQTALEFALSEPTQFLAPEAFLAVMKECAIEYGYDLPSFYPELLAALSKAYAKAPQRAARTIARDFDDDRGLADLDGIIGMLTGHRRKGK